MMSLPRVPIWQAPTGSIAGPELCAAVAGAGGVGGMGVTWTEPEVGAAWVRQVLAQTDGLFHVNFVLRFEPKGLKAVLDAGAPMVTFSWGDPGALARHVRQAGALLGIQVVDPGEAASALRHDPDFLICQGVEAGGHVQSDTPLMELLPEVVDAAGAVPVVAAGGIADNGQVARVLELGASGAMLGTRFVATLESRAHPEYKQMLVDGADTEMTLCFDGGWKHAKHRVLPNETLAKWKAAGSPPEPARPGEGEAVAWIGSNPIYRYEDTAPRVGMEGDIAAMCLYAGASVGDVHDIPTAAELVRRLWPSNWG